MKKLALLLVTLILILVGYSILIGKGNNAESMRINDHTVSYDKKLIRAIDKTKWIDIFNPPTVKTMIPEREPQFYIEVIGENESYTLWDSGEYYLVAIKKGHKDYWLALENEEYENAKNETAKYSGIDVPYPLAIQTVVGKVAQKYKNYSVYKVESELEIPHVEQEKNCFLDEKECVYFYSAVTVDEALRLKETLEEKVALMNMVNTPRIYSVKNVVILYIPNVANEYKLEDDIKSALRSFE